jgi:hypothetical protein
MGEHKHKGTADCVKSIGDFNERLYHGDGSSWIVPWGRFFLDCTMGTVLLVHSYAYGTWYITDRREFEQGLGTGRISARLISTEMIKRRKAFYRAVKAKITI